MAPNLPRLRARDALPIAILLLLLAGPQIVLGYITNAARTASDAIFVGNGEPPGGWQPQGSAAPDPGDFGSAAPFASAEPSSSPSAGPQRITILLMGVDSRTGGTPRLPTR